VIQVYLEQLDSRLLSHCADDGNANDDDDGDDDYDGGGELFECNLHILALLLVRKRYRHM